MKRNYFFLFAFLLGIIGWQTNAQFSENFDAATTLPAGWSVINGGDANTWEVFVDAAEAHSPDNYVRIHWDSSTAHDDYLITPAITVTAGVNDFISFFVKSKSSTYLENYEVRLSTASNTDPADFSVVLQAEEKAPAAWTEKRFELSSYVGQTVYIAIRATDTDQLYLEIDDFVNGPIPSYFNPDFELSLTNVDCANTGSEFSVEVNVTDMGGASSVTIADDQGSATQQITAPGTVTFGPYASGSTVNFTVTNDDDTSFNATDDITYSCPTTPGDDCFNAISATVYPLGGSAGNETNVDGAALNDSGAHPSCDDLGTNLDVWFMVTVPAGQTGFTAIFGGNAANKVESALWDDCGGNELACNGYSSSAIATFNGLTAGQTYYVQLWLDSYNSDTFTVAFEELAPAPNCAENPVPVDGATDVTITSGRRVDLSWDAPSSGPAPDSYKIEIGTVSGTYPIHGTVSGNTVAFTGVDENTTYYWKVTPINQGTEADGCVEWSFTTGAYPAAPANDTCAGAVALTVDPDTCANPTVADNSFATDSGEAAPSCAHYNGGDLWFTVTVPASGSVTIEASEVSGSALSDTGMAVYSGSCGALTELVCDDDSGPGLFSKVELSGQNPGDVFYVRVWEYDNNRFGEFNVCAYDPLAAIADNQIAGFKFYPNPVNHMLNLSANDNIEAVSITNVMGQEVLKVSPEATQTQIDMSHLQNGIYFVKAQVNGQMTAFKVIKK